MDTIISIATFATLFLSFLAGLITYKRIEKPKNRKTIAFIVSFITFFLMAFLSISDLPDYVNIIYK